MGTRVLALIGIAALLGTPQISFARQGPTPSERSAEKPAPAHPHEDQSHRTHSSSFPVIAPMDDHFQMPQPSGLDPSPPADVSPAGDAMPASTRDTLPDLLVRVDAQAHQAGLFGKRIDALEERLGAEARERWQDVFTVQRRLAEQGSRLDAQDVRWADANANRSDLPLLAIAGGSLLAILLGGGALIVGLRHRYAAMAAAEGHADTLFRTYRLEFDMLAQAAHEMEARLQGQAMPEVSGPVHRPERAVVG